METLREATHRRHAIRVEEDVGALRRAVARMAVTCHACRAGEAELVATELATNILLHTPSGGFVLFRPVDGDRGLELLAADTGPAVRRTGGLGAGLTTVERLASTFDLYTRDGAGTVVLARLGAGPEAGPFRWGAVNVPFEGEDESGDGWAVAADGALTALVVDGLGHGPGAHTASRAAIASFAERPPTDLRYLVRRAHEAMRGTRGGVIGACSVDSSGDEMAFVGVGNVSGRLVLDGVSRGMTSREGTVGIQLDAPRVDVARHPWGPGAALILASDGVRSGWDPQNYPGLLDHHPAVVAATLLRDHERGTDDATILVVQDTRRS